MPLTKEEIKKIATAVSDDLQSKQLLASKEDVEVLVASAVERACPYGPDERLHVPHGLGILKDLGNGDPAEGLRTFREIQFWGKKKRELEKRISNSVVVVIIGVIVTASASALWIGIKVLSQMVNGK